MGRSQARSSCSTTPAEIGPQTVAALPKIIAALRRRHYQLVTVPRLLLDNPAPRVQNIAAVIGSGG